MGNEDIGPLRASDNRRQGDWTYLTPTALKVLNEPVYSFAVLTRQETLAR